MNALNSSLPVLSLAHLELPTQKKLNFFQRLRARRHANFVKRHFVRCPCTVCGGMVSIREAMVQGKENWFCTEASRDTCESGS